MEVSRHLQNIRPSYIREILSVTRSAKMVSLAGGLPAMELIPVQLFAEAIQSLTANTELLQYGETQGYVPLLDYIQASYQVSSLMGSMICNGSQQGLDLVARAFINPGDKVVVEAPSYLGALQVFGLAQADIVPVRQTSTGPALDQLESLFASNKIKLFYGIPDFHNPTGVCWSLDVRQAVARLCQSYGVVFVEDAPYRDLRFSGQALPLVSSFCEQQSIILRSFSKIAAPGIRLGVVSAPHDDLSSMIKVKQAADLHTGLPMQAVLLHVLNNPAFSQHIDSIRAAYKIRYEQFSELLTGLADKDCYFDKVNGGMFVWLKLPPVDPMALAQSLLEDGVAVVPSNVFYHNDDGIQPALRLNFTYCSAAALEIAVAKLGLVLDKISA